jgi:hypothetical protein
MPLWSTFAQAVVDRVVERALQCEPVFFGMPKRRKTAAPAVAPFSAVLSSTARTISSGVRLTLFLVSVVVTFVFPSRPAPGLAPVMGRIVSRFEGHGSAPNPLERGAARSWLGPGRSGRPEALQSAGTEGAAGDRDHQRGCQHRVARAASASAAGAIGISVGRPRDRRRLAAGGKWIRTLGPLSWEPRFLSFGKKTQRLLRSREPWCRTTERTLLSRRNGEFESTSLQQRVTCELDFGRDALCTASSPSRMRIARSRIVLAMPVSAAPIAAARAPLRCSP